MSETNTCDKCSDEYEPYHVLIRNNFCDIVGHVSCEYDNLCKPCRMHVTDYGAYLTETEREELEPKVMEGEDTDGWADPRYTEMENNE